MKLVFAAVAYQGKEGGPVFLVGEALAVKTDEDAYAGLARLCQPLIAGGENILTQLFVTVPPELMAEVAKQ